MSQHEVRVAMELTCNCLVTAFFFLITDSPAISTCLRLNSGMLHIKEDNKIKMISRCDKIAIMPSDWSSCPLISLHAL